MEPDFRRAWIQAGKIFVAGFLCTFLWLAAGAPVHPGPGGRQVAPPFDSAGPWILDRAGWTKATERQGWTPMLQRISRRLGVDLRVLFGAGPVPRPRPRPTLWMQVSGTQPYLTFHGDASLVQEIPQAEIDRLSRDFEARRARRGPGTAALGLLGYLQSELAPRLGALEEARGFSRGVWVEAGQSLPKSHEASKVLLILVTGLWLGYLGLVLPGRRPEGAPRSPGPFLSRGPYSGGFGGRWRPRS